MNINDISWYQVDNETWQSVSSASIGAQIDRGTDDKGRDVYSVWFMTNDDSAASFDSPLDDLQFFTLEDAQYMASLYIIRRDTIDAAIADANDSDKLCTLATDYCLDALGNEYCFDHPDNIFDAITGFCLESDATPFDKSQESVIYGFSVAICLIFAGYIMEKPAADLWVENLDTLLVRFQCKD